MSLVDWLSLGWRRLAVCLLPAAFALPVAAQAPAVRCGVQRWPVKVLLDADTARVDWTPRATTVDSLARLPRPEGSFPTRARVLPVEGQVFRVRARIRQVRVEPDGDWHLILEDPSVRGATLIAEVPDSACAGETRWANTYAEVRRRLRTLPRGAIAMFDGVGFFDHAHGQRGAAPNNVELHPVIRVESDTAAAGPRPAPPPR